MASAQPHDPGAWVIHCDGSALPNPGRMGLGAVLVAPDGGRTALSQQAPGTGCNNEAELRALLLALNAAREQGAQRLTIVTDSQVLVEQLDVLPLAPSHAQALPDSPRPATSPPPPMARLATLFAQARVALQPFALVRWNWVPRHRNTEADALARAAVGLAPKLSTQPASARGRKSRNRRKNRTHPAA